MMGADLPGRASILTSGHAVVKIATRKGSGLIIRGTGTVIAPGRILTARHVVFSDKGQSVPDLVVRLAVERQPVPAKVIWHRMDYHLDVAVLEVQIDARVPSHPLAALDLRDIQPGELWEAQGYPAVRKEKDGPPSRWLEKVNGKTCSYIGGEKHLYLDASTHPDVWGGLSGAAVVVGKKIVGVVRGVPKGWDGQRIMATPVAAFLHEPGFREALGIKPEDERLQERVRQIRADVAKLLAQEPVVLDELAKQLEVTEPTPEARVETVADKIVGSLEAKEVAQAISSVDHHFRKKNPDSAERRIIQTLLWRILPLAVDHKQLVILGRTTLAAGPKVVELPLRTKTMAEIIMAGIDERCCEFLSTNDMPIGAALVRVPAVTHAPLLDPDGALFTQSLVTQLAAEWGIDKEYRRYSDQRDAINDDIEHWAFEAPEDERFSYYLLFIDADFSDQKGSEDALWDLITTALGKELPSLRLVRLTADSLGDERKLAAHIRNIVRDRPP